MGRLLVTLVALLLTAPPAAFAQARQGGNRPAPPPPPPTRPNVPPPPITYPFAPLMPPPAGGLLPRAGEGPPFNTDSSVFFPNGSTAYAPYIFGYPEPTDQVPGRRPRSARVAPTTGLLRLSVTPASAQVFVDSLYVGTVDDVNAQGVLQLEAGPHRLEFRAPGYATQTVDVRVSALETVTYRAALDLARPPAATAPPPAGVPTVMYVIPNCYLGNLPPRQSRLPSGCDIKQVQVLKPAPAASRP